MDRSVSKRFGVAGAEEVGRHTASTVSAALLLGFGVEAVNGVVGRSAFSETGTTGLSTRVTLAADRLLGLVSASIATNKAHAEDGHRGQAVRLGLGTGIDGTGQKGNGSNSTDEHLDCLRAFFLFLFDKR